MPDPQEPISVKDFSARVKAKYPEYKDVDDLLLAQKMVEKYPEYKSQVLFEPVKKKEVSPSPSSVIQSPSPSPSAANNRGFIEFGEPAPLQTEKKPQQVKLTAVNYDAAVDKSLKGRGIDKTNPTYKKEFEKTYKKVREGELVGHKNSKGEDVLLRGEGFGQSLLNTVANSVKATKDAFEINAIKDPQELVNYFAANPVPELESKPSGIGGELGELLGGVAKPAALLTANVVPGLGTSLMASEAYYTASARQKRELFDRGIREGLSPIESAKRAMEVAPMSALPEGAMAMALGTNLKGLGSSISKAAQDGFTNALKNSVKSVGRIAAGGGATEAATAGIQKASGYKVTGEEAMERVLESAGEWGKMDAAFKILGMSGAMPKHLLAASKELISEAPKEVKDFYISNLPEEQAKQVTEQLGKYEEAKKSVQGLVPEEHMSTFAGLVEKRNGLEKSKEGKSKALTEPIDEFIKDIDDRLSRMQKTGKVNEVDDITGEPVEPVKTHEELSKKEREGIVVPKEYGDTEVIEVGEGENKKYKAKATYKKGDGRIMTSHEIEMEGKEYTDKDKAQAAADEALAKHYYENGMAEHDKPLAKIEKVEVKEETPSTVKSEGFGANDGNKLVDDKGKPITVYHGTGENFKELDESKQNSATGHGDFGKGFYFSANEGIGKYYSLKFKDRVVKQFHLNVKNPFEINITDEVFDTPTKESLRSLKNVTDAEKGIIEKATEGDTDFGYKEITKKIGDKRFSDILKDNGYDGVFVNRTLGGETIPKSEIVVFDKEQIKPKNETTKDTKQAEAASAEPSKLSETGSEAKSSKGIIKKATSIEDVTEPRDIVMQHFAGGGKIHSDAIKELFGGKDDRIRQNSSTENERRARIGLLSKDGKGIDELAHSLWENDQTGKYTTQDYKEAIEQVLQDHNSTGSMAKELVDKYIENTKQKFTDAELKEISDDLIRQVNKEMDNLDADVQKELFSLLEKYQEKNGSINWDKLEEDTNGFTPEILELSEKTQKQLYELINSKREGQTEPINVNPKNETGKEEKNNQAIEPPKPPTEPPVAEGAGKKEPTEYGNKAILKRLSESENIKPEIREKFKENLKYKVKSHEEARTVAKEVINEYGHEEAVTLAEAGKFHGDVNSMIFGEALDQLYNLERNAKTPQEAAKYAAQWADVAIRYDEAGRSGGRFISAIGDFYKKSPLGIKLKEEAKRTEAFKEWYKSKEQGFKEVFDAIKEEPEFKEIISKEVQSQLKKERTESRQKKRKNIDDFFEKAKFKGDATYATIIPPKVINGGIEVMKQAFLAGESIANAVETAIEHISKEIKDWDKERFRKEWEDKLRSMEGKGKLTDAEISEAKKERILERFRKKLKGLSDKEKEDVIRKSFKKLVESGALEYEDFKKIIADTIGLGELTEADKVKIDAYVKDINSVQDLAEKARTVRTDKSLQEFREGAKRAEKSATALGEIVYNKPSVLNRLTSIMQLNTLGIPSLVNNPIFNVFNQAFVRFPKAVQLSVLDRLIQLGGKAFGKDIKPNTDVISAQVPFFKGVGEGGKQSVEQLFTGLTNKDYFQKEVYTSQIRPFTSLKDLWSFAKGKNHLSKSQIADKALQGTVGMPAEVVARMLNIGDKPQRFATEKASAKVIANQYGLKGMDEKLFMEFPKQEAYRLEKAKGVPDELAIKRAEEIEKKIITEGEESTFQQENIIHELINNAGKAYDKIAEGKAPLEFVGKTGKIFKVMNLPFVKIPLNAFWSYFNLVNPEVAFMQSAAYGAAAAYKKAKGLDGAAHDFEQSKKWLAHGATGMGLLALTSTLASKGIVSGDNNADDAKKEREGEKYYEQQHSLDMGKLNAWLQGKDPNEVKDGLKVDLKWYGVLGNAANLQANKYEKMDEEQRKEGINLMNDVLGGNLVPSALEVFETGVFSNASSLANAFNRGGVYADSYLTNLINMGSNVVHPAMFAQLSRAKLPYEYTTKADSFGEQIKNNMGARTEWGRKLTGKYPPSKIGIWGDELKRNDEWALRWFGMSHSNPTTFAKPIYEDYKKTGDTGFFPPSVKNELNGQKLNAEETRKLEVLIGQSRKKLVAPYVNDMAILPGFDSHYSKLSKEDKIEALKILYEQGADEGKAQFEALYPKYKKKEDDWEAEDKKAEKTAKKSELRESIKP